MDKNKNNTVIDPELGEIPIISGNDTEEEKKEKERIARLRVQEYNKLTETEDTSFNVPQKDI